MLSSSCCSCSTSPPSVVSLWIAEEVALGFNKVWRFVLAFKSHWSIAEPWSNSFSTKLTFVFNSQEVARSSLLHSCLPQYCFQLFHCWEWPLTCGSCWWDGGRVLHQCKNVFFRSFGLHTSREACTLVCFYALCVAKKLFISCHSLIAPSLFSWVIKNSELRERHAAEAGKALFKIVNSTWKMLVEIKLWPASFREWNFLAFVFPIQ